MPDENGGWKFSAPESHKAYVDDIDTKLGGKLWGPAPGRKGGSPSLKIRPLHLFSGKQLSISPKLFENFPNLPTRCDTYRSIRIQEGPPVIQ
jgi:hypothetical protein